MTDRNICRFIPAGKDYHSVHTLNFVLETKPQPFSSLSALSLYRMIYVKKGKGFFHTTGKKSEIIAGDVIFCFPGTSFAIESEEGFEYMYISFLGSRGNMIMEKLGISADNCLFHGLFEVESIWMRGLSAGSAMSDLMSESVLLYTFAALGSQLLPENTTDTKTGGVVLLVKKYIDDNFSDHELSLEKLSRALSYNKKYLSTVFKNNMKMGISEYVATVRIQHACTLAEQGFTSVKDIAFMCGFSDPLYFSRVFKSRMGISPREHISNIFS